jgi:hypothetical protein
LKQKVFLYSADKKAPVERIFVLGEFRIYAFKHKKGEKPEIWLECHYLEISEVSSKDSGTLTIRGVNGATFVFDKLSENLCDEILLKLYYQIRTTFPGKPEHELPKFDVTPSER